MCNKNLSIESKDSIKTNSESIKRRTFIGNKYRKHFNEKENRQEKNSIENNKTLEKKQENINLENIQIDYDYYNNLYQSEFKKEILTKIINNIDINTIYLNNNNDNYNSTKKFDNPFSNNSDNNIKENINTNNNSNYLAKLNSLSLKKSKIETKEFSDEKKIPNSNKKILINNVNNNIFNFTKKISYEKVSNNTINRHERKTSAYELTSKLQNNLQNNLNKDTNNHNQKFLDVSPCFKAKGAPAAMYRYESINSKIPLTIPISPKLNTKNRNVKRSKKVE